MLGCFLKFRPVGGNVWECRERMTIYRALNEGIRAQIMNNQRIQSANKVEERRFDTKNGNGEKLKHIHPG